ncbi:hypothetical protein [Secundilactobacillus malefermentans]|uniref:Uncharacterized protein n=1 Tax=Secundilactobacillus malefermentans TaxID=176292 RepID=A0A4R5NSX8_9LACO|nr:hypothetical protein [Secundilactobacillus malefermentans]KRM59664.1 hypothetical protein FD44_GL001288 [Secundilactobacillus malefermentans DSM 5705 = KCTC 3548]QEA32430.1 hypothetical protein FGL90_09695 [Secundilactobacillus malefermentans]TDG80381.1 hypothetical protein C5L31_000747 [Secundilactobacillus malefermentans]
MLKKIKTIENDVYYINEDLISCIKKVDSTVTDKESDWQVQLADDDDSTFTITYEQMNRKIR